MQKFSILKHKYDAKKRLRLSASLKKVFENLDNLVVVYFKNHLEIISEDKFKDYKSSLQARNLNAHDVNVFLAGQTEKYEQDNQGRFKIKKEREGLLKDDYVYLLHVDNDTYESVEVYPESDYETIVERASRMETFDLSERRKR